MAVAVNSGRSNVGLRSFAVVAMALSVYTTRLSASLAWTLPESRRTRWVHQQDETVSRRELLWQPIAGAAALTVAPALAKAAASDAPPTPQELERLQKGHARVKYLLDHWDDVTKECGTATLSDIERRQTIRTEGGGGTDTCTRTPLVVRDYMGYKSTNDPLYKIDRLMIRAGPRVNPDQLDDYLNAVEAYRDKADNASMLAYTSSWGESNPNGSKEVIEDFLEQTKRQVRDSEKLLRSILKYLDLPVLS